MSFKVPNTLQLEAYARAGGIADSTASIREHQARAVDLDLPLHVVGEGSNIVPAHEIEGYVCIVAIPGIEVLDTDHSSRLVRVGAGENWHRLVLFCANKGLHGLENLALIPGSVGAAPIQNIGAYGVEVADSLHSVDVVTSEGNVEVLSVEECEFAYRDSLFKRRKELIVSSITLRLRESFEPELSYPDIAAAMSGLSKPGPEDLINAIMAIRRRKLPDPASVPNAGSFFKNPIVDEAHFTEVQKQIPDLKKFETTAGLKVSAAQLIDASGWKDRPHAHVACWATQPLVLVNRGGASTAEVLEYAEAIKADIAARYAIQLEVEPSLLS